MSKEPVRVLSGNPLSAAFLKEIAENDDDSVLINDLSDLIEKHKHWLATMPRVVPHFAMKANDHLPILSTLAALGAGFDCASKGEIEKVLSVGVEPQKIIFANPAKFNSHIEYAKKYDVDLMTFDCENELYKIKNIFPNARLVLRIKCDSPTAIVCLGTKFGCDPNQAMKLLRIARNLDMNVVGLSFHVGTEVKDPPIYGTALKICHQISVQARALDFNIRLIDIGGGYEGAEGTSIKEIGEVVNDALEKYFPDPEIKIISEPGRYYVSSAFTLVCKVYSVRAASSLMEKGINQIKYDYYVNDSVFKNFNYVISENRYHVPTFVKDYHKVKHCLSTIWGQTCDSTDCIMRNEYLPQLKIGDYLIWKNMGAYTLCINSPFNGFGYAKVYDIIKPEYRKYVADVFEFYGGTD